MNSNELIECIPNISYGLEDEILQEIISYVNKIPNKKLIHIDSNAGANRTVLTLVGSKSGIYNSILQLYDICQKYIDMRKQQGVHPRIGMIDVCPLVPLKNISEQECIDFSWKLSRDIAERFHVPIFNYEKSQSQNYRKYLPQIRKGGYEQLLKKLADPQWIPDFGPLPDSEENINHILRNGATVLGVRNLLIAFNISLNTKNTAIAHEIAQKIRTIGNAKGDRGIFKELRAIGWFIEEFNHVQISMNFLNYKITSPEQVYQEVENQCKLLGIKIIGSELVGLIPKEVLLRAGTMNNDHPPKTEIEIIEAGIEYLKLNQIKPFNPYEHILEYAIKSQMGIDLQLK